MSESFGDQVYDSTIRHQIHLERFKTSNVRKLISVLNENEEDIRALLIQIEEGWSRKRLETLLKAFKAKNQKAFDTLLERAAHELEEIAEYEAGYIAKSFNRAHCGESGSISS